MVLRILFLFMFVNGTLSAQDLFYTDSYQTNLYQHNKEVFIFNNNVFSLMEDSMKGEVIDLIHLFFEENNIAARYESSINTRQLKFSYTSNSFDAMQWSINWHQKQGLDLSLIINDFLQIYFKSPLQVPIDIADAAIHKHAYYNLQTFDSRINNFVKTTLQITTSSIDQNAFINTYLEPNLSLNRLVTKPFNNYYNEAYPVQDLDVQKAFIFGPSHKDRLKDCVSLYLYTRINTSSSFIYLKDNLVLIDDSLKSKSLTEKNWSDFKGSISKELMRDVNSLDISFYNIADKRNVKQLIEDYELADYEAFKHIYFEQNSYNYALPISRISETYNKQIVEQKVFFKVNNPDIYNPEDSLILNSLASFLSANPSEHLLILGFAGKTEYEKIDKSAIQIIIDKYKSYPPVEASKIKDLSIYRAVTVFDYLAEKGIHPSRMSCIAKNIEGEKLSDYAYCKFAIR